MIDYQLKGLIFNHTLKSYTITSIESANMLKVTMKFDEGYNHKNPCKWRRDMLRKEKFLAKFRRDPVLVPFCFHKPGQSPHPAFLGGLVLAVVANVLIKHAENLTSEFEGVHHQKNHLVQKVEKADKEQDQISNWVRDLLD